MTTDKATAFTTEQKRQAIARELATRIRKYPRQVTDGSMPRTQADQAIAIMRSILADYDALTAKSPASD